MRSAKYAERGVQGNGRRIAGQPGDTVMTDAIKMVMYLIGTCRMTLRDACRAAAWEHGIDYDKLYRVMTD